MNTCDLQTAARMLAGADDIHILTHASPDGDTLGCAFALKAALEAGGRRVAVRCSDPLPEMYDFLSPGGMPAADFEPGFILAVDIASPSLMGSLWEMSDRVDLCVDHHPTNTGYGKTTLLRPDAAAAGEIVLDLIEAMGFPLCQPAVDALYLAICSDTGGFRYANTTPDTLRSAARLMELGADSVAINRVLFESKSRGLVAVEGSIMADMSYFHDGLCAVIKVPLALLASHGLAQSDVDGLSSIPRKVRGVEVGVTLKEQVGGGCRVSIRTDHISASEICARFGGGGHKLAAGCTVRGTLAEAEAHVVDAVGEQLRAEGLL